MHIHFFWMLAPRVTRILEVANQLLLLGIDADNRQARCGKGQLLRLQVHKLLLPLRMRATSLVLFDVHA